MKNERKEWIFVIGAFIFVNVASALLQPRFSFQGGHIWEQGTYLETAIRFVQGLVPSGPAPAVLRFGVPWLATLLRFSDPTGGFLAVDLFANLFAIVFFVLWLRFFVENWRVRSVLVLFYMLHWLAPTRFAWYMPLNVDCWGMLVLIGGLYCIEHYKRSGKWLSYAVLIFISTFGLAVRETVLIVPLTFAAAVFFSGKALKAREIITGLLPILLAIGAMLLWRSLAIQTGNYHFIGAAINWARSKPVQTYVLGWFVAFGPAIALLVLDARNSFKFLLEHRELFFYLAAFVALAFIGGSDTERILLWVSPVILVLFARWFERNYSVTRARWLLGLIVALQLISERVFWTTPDLGTAQPSSPLFLTSLSSNAYYFNLFSYHAPASVSWILLTEYLVVGVLIVGLTTYHMKISVRTPK
jgi:hypothetical protein